MADKIPIVVGTDGTYTRATCETFRKIAEGHVIAADAIVWVSDADAVRVLSGSKRVVIGVLADLDCAQLQFDLSQVAEALDWELIAVKARANFCIRADQPSPHSIVVSVLSDCVGEIIERKALRDVFPVPLQLAIKLSEILPEQVVKVLASL